MPHPEPLAPLAPWVFFGTPAFAVPVLEALAAAGRMPAVVVAQPARPAGRGHRLLEPATALWAKARGVDVWQPEKVRDAAFLAALSALAPAVAVVVAFGQIFPRELLGLPRRGCINLHASLLPRHRGAAPIQAAIAAGDTRTGVTTMLMEAGLDTGPILLQRETPIGSGETAGELAERLSAMGGELMVETLDRLEQGVLSPRPQDPSQATLAPRLDRASGRADWRLPAPALWNRLRAYTPWPGLAASLRDEPVKLIAAEPLPDGLPPANAAPGTYLGLREGRIAVACGAGTALGVSRLQRAGRKPLAAAEFVNGERLREGERFS